MAQDSIRPIEMTTPQGASRAIDKFIAKEKFGADTRLTYEGIKDLKLRKKLSDKMNKMAKDFKRVSTYENPTDVDYQKQIMMGLGRYNEVKKYLTKVDRARVCHYIIELMDIVQLQSSKGQLNLFTYGFDPNTMKVKEK